MVDKRTLMSLVDELSADDLEALYQHVKQRRQVVALHKATATYAIRASIQRTPSETIRAEVNAVVDDAVALVRRKRETQSATQVNH